MLPPWNFAERAADDVPPGVPHGDGCTSDHLWKRVPCFDALGGGGLPPPPTPPVPVPDGTLQGAALLTLLARDMCTKTDGDGAPASSVPT